VTDYLKLTSYFAERLHHGDRFLSDALLDLYGDHAVETSVVLRGIASFGPHHELRSDQSLSLSEDSPIAIAAVDVADKMAGLADQVSAMMSRGLVTLERAHLGGSAPTTDAAKLTIYVGRQDRADGRPAYRTVCEVLHRLGFAGASVFLGVDGTAHGQRRRARFFGRNLGVPVMIIAVGTGRQVAEALPELEALLREPLFTVERAQLCKRDGELLTRPTSLPSTDQHGNPLWQKLMVYTSEATLHDGTPIHRAIVHRLFESRAASGATVLRGVWGFHGDHKPHGDKWFQLGRRVPVTTIVVDTPDRIAASFEIVDELTSKHGLVTSELIPALVSIDGEDRRGGTGLARYEY
jgi:PII-like signaling protein